MHRCLSRVSIDYNNVPSYNYVQRLAHRRNEDTPTVGKVVLMNGVWFTWLELYKIASFAIGEYE